MIVFDDAGRRLVLRGKGRSGGEGTVFPIEGLPTQVAKIYHPDKLTAELERKVVAMAKSRPTDPAWETRRHRSIAWVERVLYHEAGRSRLAGFTMPRIDARAFREAHAYYDPSDRLRRFGGGYTWRHLMTAAGNLASAVAALHDEGHRVGDLRETNVLVAPNALISLIDCDSFQIRDPAGGHTFHTRVGTGEYLPPELHAADFHDDHDRSYSDRFALGVLIFKFLMQGVHPFQARGPGVAEAPSTEAKIARGAFPYERFRGVEPPDYAPPYEILPPDVRRLFHRCFVEGHRRPKRRPSAAEWFAALKVEGRRLRLCRANENHWFGRHLSVCPWCRIRRETGADPFPSSRPGRQIAVRAPAAAPASPAPAAWVGTGLRAGASAGSALRAVRRALARVRVTRRKLGVVAFAAALIVALASPLGHGAEAPRRAEVPWETKARGTCPVDAARGDAAPEWCRSSWRLGPVARVEQASRSFFFLVREQRTLEVSYRVRYTGRERCVLPWVDNMTFNRSRPPVCIGSCPPRIELRTRAGRSLPLIGATGVGARGPALRCGEPYEGSWIFDIGTASGSLVLRYPAFADLTVPV